jgi:hypothetical protein
MNDRLLLRIMEETVSALSKIDGNSPAMDMIPSYNAVLITAKSNHPGDPFLSALGTIDSGGFIMTGMLLALFAQLRIVLESFQPGGSQE